MQVGQSSIGSGSFSRLLSRVRSSGLLQQSILAFVASMTLSACGFVFHAIASRKLGVDQYGALYALISTYTIASIPASILAPVVVRFAAELRALQDDRHLRGLITGLARGFGVLGLVYVVVALLGAPLIGRFLNVPAWSIPLVGLLAAVGIASFALRAVAQGTQDFIGYAGSCMSEGFFKVIVVAILAVIGLGLAGGIVAFIAGSAAACLYLAWRFTRQYFGVAAVPVVYDWRRIAMASAGAASATIAATFIGSADAVLVRHFFDSTDAGLYSAAALVGKILLYLVGFIPTVLLPQATDRHARGKRTREVLGASLAMFVVVSFAGLVVFHFFGTFVLHLLVGHAFDAASSLLVGYGTAMVLSALTQALATYGIATHRLAFAIPLVLGTFATIGFIASYHPTLATVVNILIAGNLLTAIAVAVTLTAQGLRSESLRKAA